VNSTTVTANLSIASSATLGAVNIGLATTSGNTNTVPFYVGPYITSITPNSANGGDVVTVTIKGFSLTFGTGLNVGSNGNGAIVASGFTVLDDNTVTAILTIASGSSANGVHNIGVAVQNGPTTVNTNTLPFSIGPILSSISPTSGVRGTTVPVTLTGSRLNGATGVTVSGSGATATITGTPTATTVTANIVIATSAGTGNRNVAVVTPAGTTNSVTFAVRGPTLTSISPSPATHGTGVTLTLTGTNLAGATGVTISGTGNSCTVTGTSTSTTVHASCTLVASSTTRNVSVVTNIGTTNTVGLRIN
jgi:hypothetical protein